jgi:adenine-specific DNA-methyltransferase
MLAFTFDKEYYEKKKLTWRIKKKGLDKIYNKYESLKKKFKDEYSKIEVELKDWFKGLPNSDPTKLQKHYSSVDERGIYFPDNISWPGGGGPKYEVLHPITKKPVSIPSRGWMFADLKKLQELIDDNRVHFGLDETNVPCIKSYLKDRETQVPYSVFYQDGRASTKRLRNIYGEDLFKNPKDEQVLAEILEFSTNTNDYVLDFFAGTGTTYHSILMNNRQYDRNNKAVLVEMGDYFKELTKPRIQKVIYSDNWIKGKPKDNNGSPKHIFKYQVLEQYEDVLDNLQVYKGALPENLPIKYLYKPEENSLDTTLNLYTPFSNTINYGQPTRQGFIDIIETYNYLQGFFIKSIKTYELNKKYYKVIETTKGVLVIWRDIAINEDDSKQIIEIAAKYTNILTIEVNIEFATLNLDKNNHLTVGVEDIELKIISKEIFNQ